MFWSGETLKARLPGIAPDFKAEAVDCNAWKLSIGKKIYVTPNAEFGKNGRHCIEKLRTGQDLSIPPQQFAFLETAQTVIIPNCAMGFISIRASIKLKGLVNVSGFHVDPGYEGKIIFTVFNAGPKPIHLSEGEDCFLIWYADIDRESDYIKKEPSKRKLNGELIAPIAGGLQNIDDLLVKVEKLEKTVHVHRTTAITLSTVMALLIALIGAFGLPPSIDCLFEKAPPVQPAPATSTAPPAPPTPAAPPASPPPTTGAPSNAP